VKADITADTIRLHAHGPVIERRCKLCGGSVIVTKNTDEDSLSIVHREPTCNPWRNALYYLRRCLGVPEADDLIAIIDPTPLTAGLDAAGDPPTSTETDG
jgi:hypothetical protein